MKISKIHLKGLRNEEHFQFHTEIVGLIESNNPQALGVDGLLPGYKANHADEAEALDLIRKSAVTDDLATADTLRDTTFMGMKAALKSARNHFQAEKRQAAARVKIVFDHYGKVTLKPYDEETASINSLLTDLQPLSADLATLGLTDWATELAANNQAFATLKKERYTEASAKTQLRMKEVRVLVDENYKLITERIGALMVVNGESAYTAFVNELNHRIDAYSRTLAQRKGRNAATETPNA